MARLVNILQVIVGVIAARVTNILMAVDCLAWTAITNVFCRSPGYPFETFSSAAYRAERNGLVYGKARPVIDWLFSWLGQREHCKAAYDNAKSNLPEDMR